MFRQLARLIGGDNAGAMVFTYHPSELVDYLERVWALRNERLQIYSQSPSKLSPIEPDSSIPVPAAPTNWHHLIYAFAIESTGIYEIFSRVIHECLNGERLGIMLAQSQQWLRNYEDLFYKPPPYGAIFNVESRVRPDIKATRFNAYYRMFGMEPPPSEDAPVEFVKAPASNLAFLGLFEEFLREAWIGIINEQNTSGTNPTDVDKIAELALLLRQMLRARRQFGTLAREEFFAVATMSWLHLTVEFNSSIVEDLRAEDESPYRRLSRIGEKVNLLPHKNAHNYFEVAEPMARLVAEIETGRLEDTNNVPGLYTSGRRIRRDTMSVITHWSIITGRDLKAGRVTAYGHTSTA